MTYGIATIQRLKYFKLALARTISMSSYYSAASDRAPVDANFFFKEPLTCVADDFGIATIQRLKYFKDGLGVIPLLLEAICCSLTCACY